MINAVPACLDFEGKLRKLLPVFFRPVGDAGKRVLYVSIHVPRLARRAATLVARMKRRREPARNPKQPDRNLQTTPDCASLYPGYGVDARLRATSKNR
jgi:hypothetical protein